MYRIRLLWVGGWAVAALFAASLPQSAEAQLRVTADITGFAGYRYGGKVELDSLTVTIDPGVSYGFMADWTVMRSEEMSIWVEFLFSNQSTQVDEERPGEAKTKADDLKVRYFHGASGLGWTFNRLHSYAVVSLGLTRYEAVQRGNHNGFSLGLGLGLKYPTRSRWGVRVDSRWYATKTDVQGSSWICPDVGACLNVRDTIWIWQGDLTGGVFVAF